MRINPKPYTLDANERAILLAALSAYRDQTIRNRNRRSGKDDASRAAIERLETQLARIEDLQSIFLKDMP